MKWAVQWGPVGQSWTLSWHDTRLKLQFDAGRLFCSYFGKAVGLDSAPKNIPGEKGLFRDPLWQTRTGGSVELAPDNRTVEWESACGLEMGDHHFVIKLVARHVPLECDLHFIVDAGTGVLRRRTLLRHGGAGSGVVGIKHASSVEVLLPSDVDRLVHFSGAWCEETQLQQAPVTSAGLLLESRSGKTGFEHAPHVILKSSKVIFLCEILWSGNWQMHIRRVWNDWVHLSGGLNSWGLCHSLGPGEELWLPDGLLLCEEGDLNEVTQKMHDFRRRHLRPDPERFIPVQFNSWYPHPGEPMVEKMKVLASFASRLGCEVFVQDAGWYTTEKEDPAENWWTRTGDWVVNPRLFPKGLEELSQYCQSKGLAFGLWFEPEAVSPSSVLRTKHPDWFHHFHGEPPPPQQRAVLHMGVPATRLFVRDRILSILRDTGATWMKWDFNTDLGRGGWSPRVKESLARQDPLIAHYQGLYLLQDELRAAIPGLILEMCASGGGRFDPGLMAHAHTNWMSDQSQPLKNLAIHFGSQWAHPAVECNDWLIEWPPHDALARDLPVDQRGDLVFRTRIAMLGSFGISAPVDRWSEEEIQTVQRHVSWYRQHVQPLIHCGNQYLLTEPPPLDGRGEWAAIWYVSKDGSKGMFFVFRLAGLDASREFALPSLNPVRTYSLVTPEGQRFVCKGAQLMKGLKVSIPQPYRSMLFAVELQSEEL